MRRSYCTRVVFQMTETLGEYIRISETRIEHDGLWELCKGDNTAKQSESTEATFENELITLFKSQYATQKANLDYLTSQVKQVISAGGTGFSDTDLASQRTEATDENARQFQNAQDTLQNQITQSSGGSKLAGVAGATIQAKAALLNSEAQTQAAAQETITSQNALLKQQNYWNAVNALNGVVAQNNPLGYAGAATSSGNAVAGLSSAVTAANQSQLLGALGGIVGGVGSALGGGFSKGGLFNPNCWIFASFFGWHDLRTWVMRMWLHYEAPAWFRKFYLQHSKRISRTPLRWAFRPIAFCVLGA